MDKNLTTTALDRVLAGGALGPMSASSWAGLAWRRCSSPRIRFMRHYLTNAVAAGTMTAIPTNGQHGPTLHYEVLRK